MNRPAPRIARTIGVRSVAGPAIGTMGASLGGGELAALGASLAGGAESPGVASVAGVSEPAGDIDGVAGVATGLVAAGRLVAAGPLVAGGFDAFGPVEADAAGVGVGGEGNMNRAFVVWLEGKLSEHVAVCPAQAPVQPPKEEPGSGVAVSAICVP
jgi:hypothetical protein